jgi:hypothetical protein
MRITTLQALALAAALGATACQQRQDEGAGDLEPAGGDTAAVVPGGATDVGEAADRASDTGPGHTPPGTDEEKIENAMSAAPEAVAREATIVAVDSAGQAVTLREGTGAFTCLPDNPTTPGNDPMCLDRNGMAWAQAWMAKQPPPQGQIGFGYMLAGGSDASNTDPYAQGPAEGEEWIETGPHVMIFNATDRMEGYPDQAGDPTKPFVMWPGTPYAHLMVPVEN